MSILANSPPHVLVRSVMRGGTAPSRVPNFPLRRPKAASVDVFVFRKLTEKPQKKKVEDVESVEGGEEE